MSDVDKAVERTAAREGFPVWRVGEAVEWGGGRFSVAAIRPAEKRLVLYWLSGKAPALRDWVTIKGVTWEVVDIPGGGYVLEYREKAKGILAMMQRVAGQR